MDYKVVEMEELTMVGKLIQTTYEENKCFQDVPGLWGTFLEGGVFQSINNKVTGKPAGVYYEQGVADAYSFKFMCACEVNEVGNEELDLVLAPKSRYAKFSVEGQDPDTINKSWETIGAMELDRNTGFNLEVYNDDNTVDYFVSIK